MRTAKPWWHHFLIAFGPLGLFLAGSLILSFENDASLRRTALVPIAAAIIWMLARVCRRGLGADRIRAGRCPGCGYDLRGIDDRCPECGAPTPPRHVLRQQQPSLRRRDGFRLGPRL
jgi:hypothetical protein